MQVSKKKLVEELDLPSSAVEDRIIGHSRWSVSHEIIFEMDGHFYKTTYSVGATENQDEMPWDYQDMVEVTPVRKVTKTVEVWEEFEDQKSA